MGCWACGRELHDECPFIKQNPEGPEELPVDQSTSTEVKCCCLQKQITNIISSESTGREGKNYKPDDEIGVSAGRKRAAVAYAVNSEKPCEWRWKKNCGGGKKPIIGCLGGMQEHRHHGPVKNTARNEPRNVHLVCTPCHNRWHTLNDSDYEETVNETLPHSPVPATLEECSENEIAWKSGKFREKK